MIIYRVSASPILTPACGIPGCDPDDVELFFSVSLRIGRAVASGFMEDGAVRRKRSPTWSPGPHHFIDFSLWATGVIRTLFGVQKLHPTLLFSGYRH